MKKIETLEGLILKREKNLLHTIQFKGGGKAHFSGQGSGGGNSSGANGSRPRKGKGIEHPRGNNPEFLEW